MSPDPDEYFLEVISGRRRGPAAAALRGVLTIGELAFASTARCRNFLYDRRLLPIHRLGRPAVSVGNLTSGGTGKTPLVCWLAAAASAAGRKPAVLLRGYKSRGGVSDEQRLISQAIANVPVVANPDRRAGAATALAGHPDIDLFILDDAMQHRRAARDLEIVLISAADPWNNGHLLPRGLLRESPAGLRRAHAIVITHANYPTESIQRIVRRYQPTCPLVLTEHHLTHLLDDNGSILPMTARVRDGLSSPSPGTPGEGGGLSPINSTPTLALPRSTGGGNQSSPPIMSHTGTALIARKYYIACAIGQPAGFVDSLSALAGPPAGCHFFADHHPFTEQDVTWIRRQALAAGASVIVVTEKDWTKLGSLPNIRESGVPFWRAQMNLHFKAAGEQQLLDLVLSRTKP